MADPAGGAHFPAAPDRESTRPPSAALLKSEPPATEASSRDTPSLNCRTDGETQLKTQRRALPVAHHTLSPGLSPRQDVSDTTRVLTSRALALRGPPPTPFSPRLPDFRSHAPRHQAASEPAAAPGPATGDPPRARTLTRG